MNPPYVVMAFTPEEALEVAHAVKEAKKRKTQSVLKPLAPPAITVQVLAEAMKDAGIEEAKLVRG